MTSEIAIMNKEAIALASDSAVTFNTEGGQKIFTSANKLFALSKYHPVGIMIYGNANFMEVPWETIIKIYRDRCLKAKSFDSLEEYAEDFIRFLNEEKDMFPVSVQKRYFDSNIGDLFDAIKSGESEKSGISGIEERVSFVVSEKGKISFEDTKKIISKVIAEYHNMYRESPVVEAIPAGFEKSLISRYRGTLKRKIKEIFEDLPLSRQDIKSLKETAAWVFTRPLYEVMETTLSGIVIAGFGEKEIFPSLKSFDLFGKLDDFLLFRNGFSDAIDFDAEGTIVPFAQSDMVSTFMEGIDPLLSNKIEKNFLEIIKEYQESVLNCITGLTDKEKHDLGEKLSSIGQGLIEQFSDRLEEYRRVHYINPVIEIVEILPKDELAGMAESLVNLTSFKRRVSMDDETVGGPIDVAVITKGDGFIWIKRKHYFRPELNPQFFQKHSSNQQEVS